LPGIVEAAISQSSRAGQQVRFFEEVGVGRDILYSKTTLKHQRTVFAMLLTVEFEAESGTGNGPDGDQTRKKHLGRKDLSA
jgi:hypothetical protein